MGVDEGADARVAHWRVSGRVQGVGFRWFVREAACRLGVNGEVRNLPDGAVEIHASGTGRQLTELLAEVEHGPPGSAVRRVEKLDTGRIGVEQGFRIGH